MEILPIIILNFNSTQYVRECINSFKSFHNDNIKHIFIVIDNNSKTEEKENLLKFISNYNHRRLMSISKDNIIEHKDIDIDIDKTEIICVEMSGNYGFSYANNVGIKLCKLLGFKYAIIANPDTQVTNKNTILKMYELIKKDSKIGVVFPKVVDPYGNRQGPYTKPNMYILFFYSIFYPVLFFPTKIFFNTREFVRSIKNNYYEIYTSIGCFFMFNVDFLAQANYLDENVFLYSEEQILAEKMKSVGKSIVYLYSEKILHNHVLVSPSEGQKKHNLNSFIYYLKNYLGYGKQKIKLVLFGMNVMDKIYNPIKNTLKLAKNSLSRQI